MALGFDWLRKCHRPESELVVNGIKQLHGVTYQQGYWFVCFNLIRLRMLMPLTDKKPSDTYQNPRFSSLAWPPAVREVEKTGENRQGGEGKGKSKLREKQLRVRMKKRAQDAKQTGKK